MNRVVFSGRITKEPTLQTTSTGKKVCTVSIAVNEGFGDNQTTVFPNIVLWDKKAEYVCSYGKKGMILEMTGKLSQNNYRDKSGNSRRKEEYIADFVSLIFEKGNGTSNNQQNSDNDFGVPYDELPDFYGKY